MTSTHTNTKASDANKGVLSETQFLCRNALKKTWNRSHKTGLDKSKPHMFPVQAAPPTVPAIKHSRPASVFVPGLWVLKVRP